MQEPKIQNGLIGFFDILGYQSFLDNNEPEVATSEVLNILNNIPTTVISALIDSKKIPDETIKSDLESIQWLVFSDTILMAMEWDESLYGGPTLAWRRSACAGKCLILDYRYEVRLRMESM